jgi:hypothetical protein
MRILLTLVLALACNAVYPADAPDYTKAQIEEYKATHPKEMGDWDAQVVFWKSLNAEVQKSHAPMTPEQKRLDAERLLELQKRLATENTVSSDVEAEARRQQAAKFEALREQIIHFQPHGNSIPLTPEQAQYENQQADAIGVPREQLAAMYAADRATLQENQALQKKLQQQAAQSQRLVDERAAQEARRRADDAAYYARKQQRDADTWAQEQRNQADLDAYVAGRAAVSQGIVSNAAARNARDTAAVTAAAPSPAQVPQQPTRQTDPLAPNSAMQTEAAQARKGTGTDLCPNAISDIECANRVNFLQEQARGQH